MLLVKKANCERWSAEERLDDFIKRGYDLIDNKGDILKKGVAQSKEDFMRSNKELTEKITALEATIEELKKENAALKADMGASDEDGSVKCPYCDKVYASNSTLEKHIKAKHPEAETE